MTQKDVVNMLQKKQEIYFIYNGKMQLPFVRCHEESCLDYAECYANENAALEAAKAISAENPNRALRVIKANGAQRISALNDFMCLGLDAVNFVGEDGTSFMAPMNMLMRRNSGAKDQAGHEYLFNSTLQITLLYLAQELSLYSNPKDIDMKRVAPLDEEAMKNVREATYYVRMLPAPPKEGEENAPKRFAPAVLAMKNSGKKYLPIFADMVEMTRGIEERTQLSYNIVTFTDIVNNYLSNAIYDGIMINPQGIGLVMAKERAKALLTDPRFV